MALTPNDVLNKQFDTTRFRDGYDQDQVDDFLDEVLAEFQRLIAENEQLKAQLGSAPAGGPATSDAEAESLRSQLAAAQAQLAAVGAQLAESQRALQTAQQQAAANSSQLDGMNSAEYLQLARRVHEEHVREGVAKRDELIAEGESKSATLLAEAQAKHDELVREAEAQAGTVTAEAEARAANVVAEAQSQANSLVSEAESRRDTLVGTLNEEVAALTGQRDELQASVDGLKEFERSYRASLKSYLEGQLAELEGSGATGGDQSAAEAPVPPFDTPEQHFDAPEVEPAVGAPEPPTSSPFTGSEFVAPEVPESFEVPPVQDEVASADVEWTAASVEDTTSGSTPSYEIPGFGDTQPPAAGGYEEGERPSAPPMSGFGGN